MKKLLLLLVPLVSFCTVQSCKKIDVNKKSKHNFNALSEIDPDLLPTVEGGILSFRDLDHVAAYVDFLDHLTTTRDSTDPGDTLDIHAEIEAIEEQLGYTSLRSVVQAQWETQNQTGWSSEDEVPDGFFVRSPSIQSVYNADKNVIIDGKLNHLYNRDLCIELTGNSADLIERINNLPAGLTRDQLVSEFILEPVDVHQLTNLPTFHWGDVCIAKTTADTTWQADFDIERKYEDGCDNNNRKFWLYGVSLIAHGIHWSDLYKSSGPASKLDVWVDWGDGTIQTYSLQLTIQMNYQVNLPEIIWGITPEHTYASGGTRTVHIKVKRPYHTTWMAEASKTFDVPTYLCHYFQRKETPWTWKYTPDAQKALRGKICLEQNILGWPVFQAITEAYEKKNNTFKHRKADQLVAQIWFDTYVNCSGSPYHRSAAEWPTSDKTVNAKVTVVGLQQGDYSIVYSNHRIKHYNEYTSLDLQLARCN